MNYFVLVYSRSQGRLVRPVEQYQDAERQPALERRFELEREFKGQPDIEIVVLGAE
jgi:hypothetical protein